MRPGGYRCCCQQINTSSSGQNGRPADDEARLAEAAASMLPVRAHSATPVIGQTWLALIEIDYWLE